MREQRPPMQHPDICERERTMDCIFAKVLGQRPTVQLTMNVVSGILAGGVNPWF